MNLDENHELQPHHALRHAEEVGAVVRRRARWHGWVWLVAAVSTPMFLIGTRSDAVPPSVQFWIAVGFGAVGLALAVWEGRRGVTGRQTALLDRPITGLYVALMLVIALVTIAIDPDGTPAWYIALACLPSIPCLVAAWLILGR